MQLQEGLIKVTHEDYPKLLYANCTVNPDDLEEGLFKNEALVHVSASIRHCTGKVILFINRHTDIS